MSRSNRLGERGGAPTRAFGTYTQRKRLLFGCKFPGLPLGDTASISEFIVVQSLAHFRADGTGIAKLEPHFNQNQNMKLNRIALIALFASVTAMGLNGQTTPPTTPTVPTIPTTPTVPTPPSTTPPTPTIPTPPTTPTPPTDKGKGSAKKEIKGPNDNASDRAKEVHVVIAAFQKERAAYLASRKVALEEAKAATGDEKKKLLEALRVESQTRENEERTLGKQIREELKGIRDTRK